MEKLKKLLVLLRPLRKVVGVIGALLAVAVAVGAYFAFFVTHTDASGATTDGFGRTLTASPTLMRWLLEQGRLWAGWLWFFIDLAALLIGGLGGAALALWGFQPTNPDGSPLPSSSPLSSRPYSPPPPPSAKSAPKPAPDKPAADKPASSKPAADKPASSKPAPPRRVQR
jgi:hypothetical protein